MNHPALRPSGNSPSPSARAVLPELLALLALAGLIIIANARFLLTNHFGLDLATFDHDFQAVLYYGVNLTVENLRTGMLLWNKYWICGQPMLGFIIAALCHPGKWLVLTADFPTYFKMEFMLYAVIGGAGYYLLLRHLRARPLVSLVTALWAVTAGFNYWNSLWEISWRTLALYPYFHLLLVRLLKKTGLKELLLIPLILYLLITAGDVEALTLYYLGALIFFIVYGLRSGLGPRKLLARLLVLGAATMIGLLLCSVQVLTFVEMAEISARAHGFTYDFFRQTFEPWWKIFPGMAVLLSRYTEVHFGVFAFFVAAWAARRARRDPLVFSTVVVAVLAAFAMMARGTPLTWIMYHLPILGSFIRHYRMGLVINFHLLVLLGLGLEDLCRQPGNRKLATLLAGWFILDACINPFPWPVKALALAAGLAAAGLWARSSRREFFMAMVALQSLMVILPKTSHDGGVVAQYRYSPAFEKFAAQHHGPYRAQVFYPIYFRGRPQFPGAIPLQLGAVGQSLAMDSWFSFPVRNYQQYLRLLKPQIARVAGYPDDEFMMKVSFKSFDFITAQNRHLVNLLGLKYLYAYDFALRQADVYPLLHSPAWKDQPRHQGMVTEERPDAVTLAPGDSVHFEFPAEPADLLRLRVEPPESAPPRVVMARGDSTVELEGVPRGVDLVYPLSLDQNSEVTLTLSPASGAGESVKVLEPTIHNPRHTIVKLPVEGLDVYENRAVLPRAFLVEEVKEVPDDEAAGRFMSDPAAFDPVRTAVIKSPAPRLEILDPGASDGRVEWKAYPPDRVDLAVDSERGGLLVLTDNYFPGWKAFVDGVETKVFRVDLTFRGVTVPPGSHEVSFSYEPASFAVGLWQTLGTAGALIFVILAAALIRRSGRRGHLATEP